MKRNVKIIDTYDDIAFTVLNNTLWLTKNGIEIPFDGWVPEIAELTGEGDDADPVQEGIIVNLVGKEGDVEARKSDVVAMIRRLNRLRSSKMGGAVWLAVGNDSAASMRCARIDVLRDKQLEPAWPSSGGVEEKHQLGIQRAPFWESYLSTDQIFIGIDVNTVNGTFALTKIPGDVSARIPWAAFTNSDAANQLYEAWFGIRSDKLNVLPANLVSIWDCALGNLGTDASVVADANANSGNRVEVTFATVATMATRITMPLSTYANTNPDDQRGTFEVLARMAVSEAASNCNVRLGSGVGASLRLHEEVAVSSTYYLWYSMGRISIPADMADYSTESHNFIRDLTLTLDAERTLNAAAELYLDCIRLVPCDEGYIHFSGANIYTPAGAVTAYIYSNCGRELVGWSGVSVGSSPVLLDTSGTSLKLFTIPKCESSGLVVVAAQRSDRSIKTDVISASLAYIPRYMTV